MEKRIEAYGIEISHRKGVPADGAQPDYPPAHSDFSLSDDAAHAVGGHSGSEKQPSVHHRSGRIVSVAPADGKGLCYHFLCAGLHRCALRRRPAGRKAWRCRRDSGAAPKDGVPHDAWRTGGHSGVCQCHQWHQGSPQCVVSEHCDSGILCAGRRTAIRGYARAHCGKESVQSAVGL